MAPAAPSSRAIPRPAPRVAPATRATLPSSFIYLNRLRLRREVKLLHLQRGKECGIAALAFRVANSLRLSDHVDVVRGEQFDHALVEAEVFDWILDLAVFDVPDAV